MQLVKIGTLTLPVSVSTFQPLSVCQQKLRVQMCFCLQLEMSNPVSLSVADQLAKWGFMSEMESFASQLQAACWPVTHKWANANLATCTTTWIQNTNQLAQVIPSVCYWLNQQLSCDGILHLYFFPVTVLTLATG